MKIKKLMSWLIIVILSVQSSSFIYSAQNQNNTKSRQNNKGAASVKIKVKPAQKKRSVAILAKKSQNDKIDSAIKRVRNLGIIDNNKNLNLLVSRQEFAKIMTIITGNEDNAKELKTPTMFKDVNAKTLSAAYITLAIQNGFEAGKADGRFYPSEPITFAQVCTAMVRALKYTDQDVTGTWPKNYINKAKALGLTEGLNFNINDKMPAWAVAWMANLLLDTKVDEVSLSPTSKPSSGSNSTGNNSQGDSSQISKQTLIQVSGLNKDSYVYARILNPIYSKPQIVSSFKVTDKKIGNITIAKKKIIKNGGQITASGIQKYDVVYNVTDKWNTKSYILVLDDKVSGEVTGISPNRISTDTLQLDNKDYDVSDYMNQTKISISNSKVQIGNNITLLLGYDGKVVDVLSGKYISSIVMGNNITNSNIGKNQVLTDSGIYTVPSGSKLDIGYKYNISLVGSSITSILKKTNIIKSAIVTNADDSSITAEINGKTQELDLPDKITYYYNGQKQDYNNVTGLLKPCSTIIFGYDNAKTVYKYAVIVDPIYSKPEIVSNFNGSSKNVGAISLNTKNKVIKNGNTISLGQINNSDIIYNVKDLIGKKTYIEDVDTKVSGIMTGVISNGIQIDNKNYTLSKYISASKVNVIKTLGDVGSNITILIGHDGKVVDVLDGQYTNCIVEGTASTNNKLDSDEVLTDKGVYTLPKGTSLYVGCQYNLSVSGTKITVVYGKANTVNEFTVENSADSSITVKSGTQSKRLSLSDKLTYYYNGTKQNYDNVPSLLKTYSSIVFAYNKNKSDYDYAVIVDPIYGKPQIVTALVADNAQKIGNIDLKGKSIYKDGDLIKASQIGLNDVVYSVSDKSKKNSYVLVINNNLTGTITGILPNKPSANTLQIDNKNYDISRDMDKNKLNSSDNTISVNNNITAILGYDGKIVGVLNGQYQDCVIFGNSQTNSNLASDQVLTDKGTYTVSNGLKFEIGYKYQITVSGTKIVNSYGKENSVNGIVVESTDNSIISYNNGSVATKLSLSDKIPYYYNGVKENYDSVISSLKADSSIIFAYNKNKSDYDYAVIVDPVYSKPQVVYGLLNNTTGKIGDIDLDGKNIYKDGDIINTSQIEMNDVVYNVSDILKKNSYILVLHNNLIGTITDILPNKTAANILQIDNKNYDISRYMDKSKVNSSVGVLSVNNEVTAVLGYDGKVVDVLNGEYEDCVVLGNSQTNSSIGSDQVLTDKGIYTVANDMKFEIGYKYQVLASGTKIVNNYGKENDVNDIVVENTDNSIISYNNGTELTKLSLSDKIAYYYNGVKQSYSNLRSVIKPYALITFAYNKSKTDYDYAVITDPIYSSPKIIRDFSYSANMLDSTIPIIRNGSPSVNQVKFMDVIYTVSTIRGKNTHTVIVNDSVQGLITDVLPNITTPKSIEINGKTYEISDKIDFSNVYSKIKRGNYVVLLFGNDNKIIDIWDV